MGTLGGSSSPVTKQGNNHVPAGEAGMGEGRTQDDHMGARGGVGNIRGHPKNDTGKDPVPGSVSARRLKSTKGRQKEKVRAVSADKVMPPCIVVRTYKSGTTPDSATQMYTTKWYYVLRPNKTENTNE